MAQIIPLNRLAEILATRVGISEAEAQRFIQLYFETVSYGLVSGGDVSIKGLGIFSRTSDTESAVMFTPDESLVKALNAPFEAFVPVPIPGDVDAPSDIPEEDIDSQESSGIHNTQQEERSSGTNAVDNGYSQEPHESIQCTCTTVSETGDGKSSKEDLRISSYQAETNSEQTNSEQSGRVCEQPVSENKDSNANTETSYPDNDISKQDMYADSDNTDVDDVDDEHAEVYILPRRKCRSILWAVLGFLLGVLIGTAVGFYFHDEIGRYIESTSDVVVSKPDVTIPPTITAASEIEAKKDTCASDTHNIVAEKAHIEPRYDIVTSHQFLTTLAKKYYGVKDYWVYIYEANKSRLRHPDRIKPGTRILIPEITEFLPDPTPTEANIRQARQLAIQIYDRYN